MLPKMKYLENFADTKGKHSAIKIMFTAYEGKKSPSHSGQCLKIYLFFPGTLFCKLMKKKKGKGKKGLLPIHVRNIDHKSSPRFCVECWNEQ